MRRIRSVYMYTADSRKSRPTRRLGYPETCLPVVIWHVVHAVSLHVLFLAKLYEIYWFEDADSSVLQWPNTETEDTELNEVSCSS